VSSNVKRALAAADLRVLVICLFHLTGDEKWLGQRYRPGRDTQLVADPAAGFAEDVQEEIRAAAEERFEADVPRPVVSDPGPELFRRMMSHCLGEEVPPAYTPLMRADFGFPDETAFDADSGSVAVPADPEAPLDVTIIGAGLSGVCLASKLAEAGFAYAVIERHSEVGGTWLENKYPGCGVDTPNHFYSYSFRPNPAWKYYFSPRDELQAYIEACATEFGIRDGIRFNSEVRSARWDEAERRWHVTVRAENGTEETLTSRVLIGAAGHFNQPTYSDLPGVDDFAGDIFHTARWPDGASLRGKRVGVIGTGASAMQVVPAIADEVASLTIFQRTPQWVRPVWNYDRPVDEAAQWLFEEVPFYAKWYRFTQFWRFGDGLLRHLTRDPEWPFDGSINRRNDQHREELTAYISSQLEGRADLLEQCLPHYPPFGKRILIDNGWYSTLRKTHVTLVTESVQKLEPGGVRVASRGLFELDAVVLATGFKVANIAACFDITGREGASLADDWADENPTAYLGMAVPRFPNFFIMFGPNTNMGHGGSAMWLAETQSHYIVECLKAMRRHNIVALDVREDARSSYTDMIDDLHDHLIWTHPKVTTYYRNSFGKVRSPMPFRLVDYWRMTRTPDLAIFHVTTDERADPR
jgi:4-hydroxyacetophenone monooxygenase